MNNMDPFINYKKVKELNDQILQQFQQINKIATNTQRQSCTLIVEQQKDNLYLAQDKLLTIAQKLYTFLEDGDMLYCQICWNIQVKILKRGQFFLNHIGFTQSQINQIKNKQQNSKLNKKIKLSLRYQQILYKVLILALNNSINKYRKEIKNILETYKAFCYIRIPIFREILLKSITKDLDNEVIQYKIFENQNFQVKDGEGVQQTLLHQINWDAYFYRPIQQQTQSKILNQKLGDNIKAHAWFDIVGQRKNEYFYFLRFLNEKFEELGKKSKFSKWQYLPGYNKVVRSFLTEMKKIEIATYTKSLQIASVYMLVNEKLINVLMSILMQKTNCHDSATVMRTLQLFSSYFKYLTTNKPTLPLTFNYIYFLKALKRLFEKGFSYAVTKALVLIYNYYHNFSVEFRKNLAKYLLGKAFFKLFLNWSFSVRSVFFHLMILKFDDQINSIHQNMLKMSEVFIRYRQVLSIIFKAEKIKQNQDREKTSIMYEKELYKFMKRKIYRKKNKLLKILDSIKQNQQTPIKKPRRPTFSHLNSLQDDPISFNSLLEISKNQKKYKLNKVLVVPQDFKHVGSEEYETINLQSPKRNSQQTQSKVRKFSFFGQQDFFLAEIELSQIAYLHSAVKQFREIETLIKKYIADQGKLQQINLDLDIFLDEKDLRPSSIDTWN